MIRRDFLKTIGAVTAGAAVGLPAAEAAAKAAGTSLLEGAADAPQTPDGSLNDMPLPIRSLAPRVNRRITVVVIGAGSVIPEGVTIGKNTAISGITEAEDYPDGALPSGGYILKKEGKR